MTSGEVEGFDFFAPAVVGSWVFGKVEYFDDCWEIAVCCGFDYGVVCCCDYI